MMDANGIRRLEQAVQGRHVSVAPWDEDAPVADDLADNTFATLNPRDVDAPMSEALSLRCRVRYLAALFPDASFRELAEKVEAVVGSGHLSSSDIRLILQGRSLSDPSRRTREVPVETIQMVGGCLSRGMTRVSTARALKVSTDTVEAIDVYLGITEKRRQRLIEQACDAVRDGLSVRKFAARVGEPNTNAHRLLVEARRVLAEIGEVAA